MIFKTVPGFLDALTNLSRDTKRQLVPELGVKPRMFGYRERGTENRWIIPINEWRSHYLGVSPRIVRVELTTDGHPWPAGIIGMHDALARWLNDLRRALPNYGSEGGYLIDSALIEAAERDELPTAWSRLLGDDDEIGVD